MIENTLPSAPAWVRWMIPVIGRLPAGRYRLINRMCRRVPSAFLARLSKELGGLSFRGDLGGAIAREVCLTGRYEPQETRLVQAILKPGMSFVDVGANWGYFTLLAAQQVGTNGKVVSLEPDPRLFPVLAANIAMNGLRQASALQVAAASEPGWLPLAGFDERMGNFGLSRIVGSSHENCRLFQVAARPLDAILQELGLETVDLLKMDIEGAEGLAFQGLQQSLAQRRVRRILLELHPAQLAEQGQDPVALIVQLRHFGFEAWKIDHSDRVNRWAAYQRRIELNRILAPLDSAAPLDRWPHILLVLQGMEAPC